MSTAAAFSCDISERDIAADQFPGRDYWTHQWRASDTIGNQATDVTLIEERNDWLVNAYKRLAGFSLLERDWDSYAAEPPSAASIEMARYVLSRLARKDFRPTDIDPSVEGGVCLSFRRGNRYGDVECFNSGDVLAVTSLGGVETDVWEVDDVDHDLSSTLERLRAFVGR